MTPSDSEKPFLERVRQSLPDLHPAERQLGEFLVQFPGEIASYNAQELASLAQVSKATVSRFVRRLGFENYEEARRMARDESRTGSRLFLAHPDGPAAPDHPGIAEEIDNLERSFSQISPDQIASVAAELLNARRVWLVGFRISQSFATYLYWQLLKVLPDVAVVPRGGETMGEHIAVMEARDCVIVFGLRRRVATMEPMLDAIAATGAKLCYITDESAPTRRDLTWHFHCVTATRTPQFNHAAVLALCHRVMVATTQQAGREGRAQLSRIEQLNEQLGQL
ncbi:MurR/RpiR family transcriptional regulator [Roseicitreum antarcticum]|uniref:Transcriptional regulator, RpiR family n=1 Tax=Roseicitreum antarcticum TaxID=564137 RepID=A0A1H2TMX5_9RHOB|nr:MurR/RpiR family transcriptional regulator [Roseicitreum antarcticum]SDW44589.1 transcriptional regulator, RpiR family [Roseicitreum antarcticum]